MLKLSTILFVLLFSVSIFAQSTLELQRAQKIDVKETLSKSSEIPHFNNPTALEEGSQLFFTDYDYAGNNSVPKMLYMYDLDGDGVKDVFMVGMKRIDGGTRGNNLVIGLGGDFSEFLVSDPEAYTGWGTMQVAEAGPLAGKVLIMGHTGGITKSMNFDLTTFSPDPVDSVTAGNFPSFVYLDDGTFWVTNANGIIFKSNDNFATLDAIASLDLPDTNVTDWNSEYPLKRSPNGQYILHFTTHQRFGGAEGGFGGANEDSTDVVVINYSTDGGETWTLGEIIGRDGATEVANRPGYYPIFENFGQINGVVGNDGVMHITMNGYGFWDNGTDTTFAYPAVYWNSADRQWLAFSDPQVEQTIYADTNATYERPGNGLGNAYPIPAVSEDGQTVVVMWQGPEYAGTPGVGDPNVWAATTENPNEIHYTDLYYAYSSDGGQSWSESNLVPGASAQNVQETFPYLNATIGTDGANAIVDFVYMVDAIPGVSLFDGNNGASNDSYWVYDQFTIDNIVSVDNNIGTIVNSFELEQNYPNPFNPTTQISFTLAEKSTVSLKVFDILGSEVTTLVNEVKEAGKNTINFDASNLSTGMYIYTLKANNFTSSKKMLLLK